MVQNFSKYTSSPATMKGLILLAFVVFCSLDGAYGEDKKTEFHFIRIDKMNDTDDLYKYEVKSVDKINSTTFIVNFESDVLVDLDDEWHMWVQAFHNAEGKEEFGEKPYISMPKKGVCEFLKGPYKERFYPQVKDHSNLPDPEECPIKARHYEMKDLPFNVGRYSAMTKPGLWRIDLFLSQDHDGSHVTKIGVSIFSSVTQE